MLQKRMDKLAVSNEIPLDATDLDYQSKKILEI